MNPMSPIRFEVIASGMDVRVCGDGFAWVGTRYLVFKLFTWNEDWER